MTVATLDVIGSGVKVMSKTNEMVETLEDFIIRKVKGMEIEGTSPEEITALSELVEAVNKTPRSIELESYIKSDSISSNNLSVDVLNKISPQVAEITSEEKELEFELAVKVAKRTLELAKSYNWSDEELRLMARSIIAMQEIL